MQFGSIDGAQTFESPVRAPGWLAIFSKRIRDGVRNPDPHVDTMTRVDDVFLQAEKHSREAGNLGPSTFDLIIQKFASARQQQDRTSGTDKIRTFFLKEYLSVVLGFSGNSNSVAQPVQANREPGSICCSRFHGQAVFFDCWLVVLDDKNLQNASPWEEEDICLGRK